MQRDTSLDIFRGFTVAFMVLVNSPGSWDYIYAPLAHASWHGLTPTDLVFPFFLFCVGAAIFYSGKRITSNRIEIFTKAIKRTLILFGLGVLLNWFPFQTSLDELRIMGVLQRIAICYLIVFVATRFLTLSGLSLVSMVTLILYYLLMIEFSSTPFSTTGSLNQMVDLSLLGEAHMWHSNGIAFDPEGLISTIPSCVSVAVGFLFCAYKERYDSCQFIFPYQFLVAVSLVLLGLLVSVHMPINKSLWTSSYVLVTGGLACFALTGISAVIHILPKKLKSFSIVYGTNPILVYCLSWVLYEGLHYVSIGKTSITQHSFQFFIGFATEHFASLLFAILHVLLFWGVSWWLNQKQIFLKV